MDKARDTCPKCGVPGIWIRYQRNGYDEWLAIRCERCGYAGTLPVFQPAGWLWRQGPWRVLYYGPGP